MRNKEAIAQVGRIAVGEAICVGLMLAIYCLLGRFTVKVLIGGLLGGSLAVLNFLFLSIAVTRAADRALQGEAAKATASVQAPCGGAAAAAVCADDHQCNRVFQEGA